MANLTDQEDRDLKKASLRSGDIRRDFSVIHSRSMKKNHLFLGPARFVNVRSPFFFLSLFSLTFTSQHDCNNNCELFREGRYITFRVLRPIQVGEEITAHYGDGYCVYHSLTHKFFLTLSFQSVAGIVIVSVKPAKRMPVVAMPPNRTTTTSSPATPLLIPMTPTPI